MGKDVRVEPELHLDSVRPSEVAEPSPGRPRKNTTLIDLIREKSEQAEKERKDRRIEKRKREEAREKRDREILDVLERSTAIHREHMKEKIPRDAKQQRTHYIF